MLVQAYLRQKNRYPRILIHPIETESLQKYRNINILSNQWRKIKRMIWLLHESPCGNILLMNNSAGLQAWVCCLGKNSNKINRVELLIYYDGLNACSPLYQPCKHTLSAGENLFLTCFYGNEGP